MSNNDNSSDHPPSSNKKGKTASAAGKGLQSVKARNSASDAREPSTKPTSKSKMSEAEEIVNQELAKQGVTKKGVAKKDLAKPEGSKAEKSKPEASKQAMSEPETLAEPEEEVQIVDQYSSQCLRVWPD